MGHSWAGALLVAIISVLSWRGLLLSGLRRDQPGLVRPSARLEAGVFDEIAAIEPRNFPLPRHRKQGGPGGTAKGQHTRRQEVLLVKWQHDILRVQREEQCQCRELIPRTWSQCR